MSRTNRTPPPGLEHIDRFYRDHSMGVLPDPHGHPREVWGRYRKRRAKKEMAKIHRQENKKKLKQELDL